MPIFKCKKCGGTIQFNPGDIIGVCDTCGMKQTLPELDSANKANPLLRRVFMFLEDGDWKRADEYCEKVLDLDPENAEAYLGKLMAELHVKKREALKDQQEPFDDHSNYQKVLRFGDEKLKQKLTADVAFIKDRNETAREEARIAKEKAAKKCKKTIAIIMPIIFICIAFVIVLTKVIIPTQKYNAAIDLYNAGKYEDAIAAFTAMDGYKDSAAQIEKCKTAIKDEKYAAAVELYTAGKYEDAIAAFTAMDGYRDSAAQIEKCKTAIKDEKYAAAVELYTAGKYEDAIAAFTAMDGYKDSAAQIEKCETAIKDEKYTAAVELFNACEYGDAIRAFAALDGYKDSAAQIETCKTAIKDEKYAVAIELYYAGKYEEAMKAFKALDGHKDSASQIEKCETAIKDEKYVAAVELYTSGKYIDAIAAYKALDGYKDSTAKINEIKHSTEWMKVCPIGETVLFGSYEQDNNMSNGKEDIEWLILSKEENKALLISKYALDCQKYNSTRSDVTWETCSLRRWLNGTFLNNAFTSEERNRIPSSIVTADKNPGYKKTSPGNNTKDKVFCLSITEVTQYFSSESARLCQGTDYCYAQGAVKGDGFCWWWLRSPGKRSNNAAFVYYKDWPFEWYYQGESVDSGYGGVRPAMWIDLGAGD